MYLFSIRVNCENLDDIERNISVPITVKENIYDDEGQSTTPSTTGGGEDESDTTLALTSNTVAHVPPHRSTTVTWKNMLSPSTESSSSNYNNERYQWYASEKCTPIPPYWSYLSFKSLQHIFPLKGLSILCNET